MIVQLTRILTYLFILSLGLGLLIYPLLGIFSFWFSLVFILFTFFYFLSFGRQWFNKINFAQRITKDQIYFKDFEIIESLIKEQSLDFRPRLYLLPYHGFHCFIFSPNHQGATIYVTEDVVHKLNTEEKKLAYSKFLSQTHHGKNFVSSCLFFYTHYIIKFFSSIDAIFFWVVSGAKNTDRLLKSRWSFFTILTAQLCKLINDLILGKSSNHSTLEIPSEKQALWRITNITKVPHSKLKRYYELLTFYKIPGLGFYDKVQFYNDSTK